MRTVLTFGIVAAILFWMTSLCLADTDWWTPLELEAAQAMKHRCPAFSKRALKIVSKLEFGQFVFDMDRYACERAEREFWVEGISRNWRKKHGTPPGY